MVGARRKAEARPRAHNLALALADEAGTAKAEAEASQAVACRQAARAQVVDAVHLRA